MASFWPLLLDFLPHSYLQDWVVRLASGKHYVIPPDNLKTEFLGLTLKSPVIAAAGVDRAGEHVDNLMRFGFGAVEVGSVTLDIERSAKDCLKIEKSEARVTHLGACFNWGALKAKQHLLRVKGLRGLSISPNQYTLDVVPNLLHKDFSFVINELYSKVDYFALSLVSRPDFDLSVYNSPAVLADMLKEVRASLDYEIGLKVYQDPHADWRFLVPPVFVKLNCDCVNLETIVNTCLENEVDGLIVAGNSALGVGGEQIKQQSLDMLKRCKALSAGRLTLLASGGISSGAEALERLKAGASAVQVYTAVITRGPKVVGEINNELSALLAEEGFKSVTAALRHYHRA
mmetsp:Transcript_3405/g.7059  ORF Transcript_3405/g.7059 Transcript_3405/m.7059 type:complete len:345 (+) Transcript_3405:1477-2511(+)